MKSDDLETLLRIYLKTNGVEPYWAGRTMAHLNESGLLFGNRHFWIDIAKPKLRVLRGTVELLSFDVTALMPDTGQRIKTRLSYSGPKVYKNWRASRGEWKPVK